MKHMTHTKRGLAIFLAAILLTEICSVNTDAAKKPALSKRSLSLQAGDTYKVKLKNGNKKASVTWKINKKQVAAIVSKSTKGGSAYAKIKAKKAGKATLTANYKSGKTKMKYQCTITVKSSSSNTTDQTSTDQTPVSQTPAVPPSSSAVAAPTAEAPASPSGADTAPSSSLSPSPAVTPIPTPTPVPEPTPTPFENLVEVNTLPQIKSLPDLMTYIDGTPVTEENWAGRAEEIRQMYQYYMYGMWRNGEGEELSYSCGDNGLTIQITVDGSVEGQAEDQTASFTVEVNIPNGTPPESGWPVIVAMESLSEKEYALENGYAVINYDTSQVSKDSALREGAFYTLYPYDKSDWRKQSGVLMAWAWGASKILDALYAGAGQQYKINPNFAIVGGVSRWGKATALAGAFDTRYKIALPTCSGCGGMGVFRYNPNAQTTQTYDVSSLGYGTTTTYKAGDVETLGSIQSDGESYWFNQRFLSFHSIYNLPFDQHFLSALYAAEGRTLMLIGGFNWDTWQNTPSLWLNFQKSKEVFDMLGLENNIIINLHDTSMGHNIVHDDLVKLFQYCKEMYEGIDLPDFKIADMHTTLFDLTETPSGINNKEVYEAQLP